MAITAVFDVPGMTRDQYDRTIQELEAQGEAAPSARRSHVASEKPGGWLVVDVWDTPEDFQRFGSKLVPILQNAGVTPVEPQILPTHNVVVRG